MVRMMRLGGCHECKEIEGGCWLDSTDAAGRIGCRGAITNISVVECVKFTHCPSIVDRQATKVGG
jgi:hypothetical protein